MTRFLDRTSGFFPAAVAFTLPVVFMPTQVLVLGDLYILPRASIVIAGACLGTGLALLVPNPNRLGALRWPLLLAVTAVVLAFAFSVSWPLSLAGSYSRYESLPMRLAYLGLLASAAWLIRTHLQRSVLIAAFVLGCSIAAVQALAMAYINVPFRPDGNLGNANLLAALLVMAIPLAVDQARRTDNWWLAMWSAAIVVMGGGLLVTTSRSGFIGVAVALAALILFAVPKRFLPHASAIGLASVAGVLLFLNVALRRLNDDPPELRLGLWRDGLRLIAARPLTGWGEDTTGLTFGRFLSQDYASLVTFDRIHSGPLDVAATQGILGLAAAGVVVAIVLVHAWRNWSAPHAAGLAAALAGYSAWVLFNFDWAPATGAFWLLAGVLWSVVGAAPPAPADHPTPAAWGPPKEWGGVAAVVLAIAVIPLAVFPVLADAWYVEGRPDLSVRVDPLQAQYHWAIGTVSELRRAADLGENDPGMYVTLGDAEMRLGNTAEARRAYQRALQIDPYYTPAADRLARISS